MENNNINNNEKLLEKGNASTEQENFGTTFQNDADKLDKAETYTNTLSIDELDLELGLDPSTYQNSYCLSAEEPEIDQEVLTIDNTGNTIDGERLLKEILKETL